MPNPSTFILYNPMPLIPNPSEKYFENYPYQNQIISVPSQSPQMISIPIFPNSTPIADIEHHCFNPQNFFFFPYSYDDLPLSRNPHTNDYGPDNIPIKLIKSCLLVLIPILYYNFSLQNSVFPSSWKTALV